MLILLTYGGSVTTPKGVNGSALHLSGSLNAAVPRAMAIAISNSRYGVVTCSIVLPAGYHADKGIAFTVLPIPIGTATLISRGTGVEIDTKRSQGVGCLDNLGTQQGPNPLHVLEMINSEFHFAFSVCHCYIRYCFDATSPMARYRIGVC